MTFDIKPLTDPKNCYQCENVGVEFFYEPNQPESVFLILHGDLQSAQSRSGNLWNELVESLSAYHVNESQGLKRMVRNPEYQSYLASTEPEFIYDDLAAYRIDGGRLPEVLGALQLAGKITEGDVKGALEKFGQQPEISGRGETGVTR